MAFSEGGLKGRVKNALNFQKASWVVLFTALLLVAGLTLGLALDKSWGGSAELIGAYTLENAEEGPVLKLFADGVAEIVPSLISSYLPPKCRYRVEGGEVIFQADTAGLQPGAYGVADGQEIARFRVEEGGVLVFVGASVPLYIPEGARFKQSPGEERTAPSEDVLTKLYLGMPQGEVEAVLGRRDGEGSGLNFWLYEDLGSVYFSDGLATRFSLRDRIWDVDELVGAAVLAHNRPLLPAGEYLAESHVQLALAADEKGFTVYVVSQCQSCNLAGDYDIRVAGARNTPLSLTFTKDPAGHYQLAEYWEPEGDGKAALRARFPESTWAELDSEGYLEYLGCSCEFDTWFHFFGAAPYTAPLGIELGTVLVTNVAAHNVETAQDFDGQDYAYFLVRYFPGARIQIEEADIEKVEKIGAGWFLQYTDAAKNRAISGPEEDIEITPDLLGLYQPLTGRYAIAFKEYIYP